MWTLTHSQDRLPEESPVPWSWLIPEMPATPLCLFSPAASLVAWPCAFEGDLISSLMKRTKSLCIRCYKENIPKSPSLCWFHMCGSFLFFSFFGQWQIRRAWMNKMHRMTSEFVQSHDQAADRVGWLCSGSNNLSSLPAWK